MILRTLFSRHGFDGFTELRRIPERTRPNKIEKEVRACHLSAEHRTFSDCGQAGSTQPLLATTLVAAAISTDNTYLHSWGSIFIQDVVLPLRKKALTPRQHVFLLRAASLGVAIFAFFFSLLFPLKDYIFMFMDVTGAIFLGGAGSAIIGGLYCGRGQPRMALR